MKWLTFGKQRAPGFRFNLTDLIFLVFLAVLSGAAVGLFSGDSLYLIPLYLGLSFFLFCNVSRIGNRLEAVWYIPFTLAAAWCVNQSDLMLFWWLVTLVFEPLKWTLIGYRIWRGPYLGVCSRLPAHGDEYSAQRENW